MSDSNTPSMWQQAYERGADGWDLGQAAPAFLELLETRTIAPGRMIVLGAGRGHDARAFARHGFDVTAVDFTEFAVAEMNRLAESDAPVHAVQHDIFTLPHELDSSFAYVLEHTCFCAIDPDRRAEYADLVTRLLEPGGYLIDLAFPLDKRVGGPPFTVSVAELVTLFGERGFTLVSQNIPTPAIPARRGREMLLLFQKRAS